jgi:hypothetical protein
MFCLRNDQVIEIHVSTIILVKRIGQFTDFCRGKFFGMFVVSMLSILEDRRKTVLLGLSL